LEEKVKKNKVEVRVRQAYQAMVEAKRARDLRERRVVIASTSEG
jgi:hypothetical protein